LSSRPDLLPDLYIEELRRLVDEVPPVAFAEIDAVIQADLGSDVFASIDPQPLATASIAQTHRALMKNGRAVVVKVRRPGVVEQVEVDLALLRSTARLLSGHSETAQLLQLEALADELAVHLRAELDFGLLGRLDEDTRRGLSLLLLAIAQNRADDVADMILALSLTAVRSDQPGFVQDVRRKLPRFHWRPLRAIRAGQALADLQRIA